MFPAFDIAVAGMRAASLRAEAAARNIAAAGSSAPRVTVDQSSLPGGIVEAKLRTVSSPEGEVANIDPVREFSSLIAARMDFVANAMVARVASDMAEQLYRIMDDDHDDCCSVYGTRSL